MNPLDWIKTRAQLAGLMAAAILFFGSTAVLGVVLMGTNWKLAGSNKARDAAVADLGLANQKLGACEVQTFNLQTSLNEQNAYVHKLEEEGKAAEAAGLRRLRDAEAEAARQRSRAERLARAKPTGDVCASARTLIVETLSEERQ